MVDMLFIGGKTMKKYYEEPRVDAWELVGILAACGGIVGIFSIIYICWG